MTVVIMDIGLLQAADGKANRIRDKVDRCQRATAAIICSFDILPQLRGLKRELEDFRPMIGGLEVSTDEDRRLARMHAQFFMKLAKKIESTEGKYKQGIETMWPIFGFITNANLDLLDEIYCLAEDAAETLALVASSEFMESLGCDLRMFHGGA